MAKHLEEIVNAFFDAAKQYAVPRHSPGYSECLDLMIAAIQLDVPDASLDEITAVLDIIEAVQDA